MKRTSLLSCYLITILLLSACDNKPESYYESYDDTFAFEKKNDIVNITSLTTSYSIKGKVGFKYDHNLDVKVCIASDYTTANIGKHYLHPEPFSIYFGKKTQASTEITLIPENITEEVQIAFTTLHKVPQKDYTNFIDTLIVRFIPE